MSYATFYDVHSVLRDRFIQCFDSVLIWLSIYVALNIFFWHVAQQAGSSDNAYDLYLAGIHFETQPEHVYLVMFFLWFTIIVPGNSEKNAFYYERAAYFLIGSNSLFTMIMSFENIKP
jgi:hypothetical protein